MRDNARVTNCLYYGTQKEMGIQRETDSQNSEQGGSCHVLPLYRRNVNSCTFASAPTSQESKRPFLSFIRDHILTQKPYPKANIQKTISRKEFPQQFSFLFFSFQNRIIILSVIYMYVCIHSSVPTDDGGQQPLP